MKSIVLALFVLFSASAVQAAPPPAPGVEVLGTGVGPVVQNTTLIEVAITPTRVRACFGPIRISCCRPIVLVRACCRPVLGCRTIRVEDPDHVAPCSVPTKITVRDPYTCKDVQLTVCMPKGCCVKPCVTREGRKVQYDFGEHEVEIHFSRTGIVIDYDD